MPSSPPFNYDRVWTLHLCRCEIGTRWRRGGVWAGRRIISSQRKHQVNINVCSCVTGDCDFEKPFSSCGYTQGRDDDLDWEQFDTSEKASLDPWMPQGKRERHTHTHRNWHTQWIINITWDEVTHNDSSTCEHNSFSFIIIIMWSGLMCETHLFISWNLWFLSYTPWLHKEKIFLDFEWNERTGVLVCGFLSCVFNSSVRVTEE